ncbi:unnamed protein product [Eruca vesicaria subsp. sativa]|uniref:Defensin-like protein n=1 Tax=Eruca vesicaria subsp. sativa TaxID=29727 RepID=A0ABC8IVI3_ERUVS|nr:unnamed protein product [Eruca vesicaria subsp. sativa]
MERITPLVLLVSLLIIFASVVNQTRANICVDGLGTCENCDQRCKSKHGPSSQGDCSDRSIGEPLCRCHYQCEPSSLTSLNTCNGNAGLCSRRCPEQCCDVKCRHKFTGGNGFCNSLDYYNVCQCQYPC